MRWRNYVRSDIVPLPDRYGNSSTDSNRRSLVENGEFDEETGSDGARPRIMRRDKVQLTRAVCDPKSW
jgi:hypothetical protein